MDVQSITIFVKVAETGSLTEAANQLDMTPSGVSKSLRRLEENLNVRLVTRTTRHVNLTEEGRMLLDQFRQILSDIEGVKILLENRLARPNGRLRLQVPVGLGRRVIIPLMVAFTRQFAEISVDVETSDRYADPAEEGIDATIRIGEPTNNYLIARKLGEIQFQAVASPGYIRRHGEPQTPDDLVHHQCLSYYIPQNGRYREWHFRKDGQEIVRSFPGQLNVNNAQSLMQAAIEGGGIALVSKMVVSDAIRTGQLKPLLREYVSVGPPAWLVYSERRFQLPRVSALVKFLVQNVPKALERHNFDPMEFAPQQTA